MKKCDHCTHNLCAKKVPIFAYLSENELIKIVNMTGNRKIHKGDVILREGETSSILYIINEGKIKLSKITKAGKEQIVHILSHGDFFGEMNLFIANSSNNYNAVAITDANLCTLSKIDLEKLLLEFPNISLKILQEISKRLQDTENLAQTLATNDVEIRIAYMIGEFMDKYGVNTKKGIKIECPLSREEMANYTGVSRETISRKLKKFENLGIIELIGNKIILIKDEEILRTYLT
jgi:CRP/FNR family transcriptional regulator